jgi:FKBP-type peptidyl-prolyl cis-trans isomerase 2
MTLEKGDFIEIEFSATLKDGQLVDTTKKEEAKKAGLKEDSIKPLIICLGNDMLIPGLEEDVLNKELGKDFSVEVKAEKAFGKRHPQLIQMVSVKNFHEQKINPEKGMQFSLDGRMATILSNSGGRVLLDFNNPLAGKEIIYNYKILRKVDKKEEQLDAMQEFFFKRKFDSKLEGDSAKIKVDKEFFPLFEIMKKRFEDILKIKIDLEKV